MAQPSALSRQPRVGAVAFDLDGTLIDSVADIARAANFCLRRWGLGECSQDEIRSFVGDGARALMQRASGLEPSDPGLQRLVDEFSSYYAVQPAIDTRLLPGAREVLCELKSSYPLALCTNKPRGATEAILYQLGIATSFDAVVAAGDVRHAKPDPAPLLRVAELLGVAPPSVVMVGDGPQDVGCAQAAGCRAIGLREAVIVPLSRLEAARPDALCSLAQVPALLRAWDAASEGPEHLS